MAGKLLLNLRFIHLRPSASVNLIGRKKYLSSTQLSDNTISAATTTSIHNDINAESRNNIFTRKKAKLFEMRSPKADTDIITVLQNRYHPAITRAYLKSRRYLNKRDTESELKKPFQTLLKWSDNVLLALSQRGNKQILRPILECYLSSAVNTKRRMGGDLVIGMLQSITSSSSPSSSNSSSPVVTLSKQELLVIISTLRVLAPRSTELWLEVDRILCAYVDKSSTNFDPEIALLLSHTLVSGFYENRLRGVEIQSINKLFSVRQEELLTYLNELGRNISPDTIVATAIDPITASQVISDSEFGTSESSTIKSSVNLGSGQSVSTPISNKAFLNPAFQNTFCRFFSGRVQSSSTRDHAPSSSISVDDSSSHALVGVTDTVFDSFSVEHFSLFLEALTYCSDKKIMSKGNLNNIFNRLYISFLSILFHTTSQVEKSKKFKSENKTTMTAVTKPLKFPCLAFIAKQLAKLYIPNSVHYDLLNKSLYLHMIESLKKDSYQLVHEELKAVETFESMVASNSKSHYELIRLICEFYRDKGLDIGRIGSRLFNVLSTLEAFSFAVYMLDLIFETSCSRSDSLFIPHDFAHGKISVMAKTRIYHHLKNARLPAGHPNALSNLMLSLYCFNSDSKLYSYQRPNKTYERFLDESESVVHKNLSCYPIDQLLKLHKSYATVGRRHPDLCRELDLIFSQNYHLLSDTQISALLWSNARLNIATSYNRIIGKAYLSNVLDMAPTAHHATEEAARTVWAMAVLQILQPEEFLLVEPLLLSSSLLHSSTRSEAHPTQVQRMKQILAEMRLCLFTRKNQPSGPATLPVNDDRLENTQQLPESDLAQELKAIRDKVVGGSRVSSDQDKWEEVYSRMMAPRPWENLKSLQPIDSSHSHKEVCKVLTFMGIHFEMEKTLEFGLVVDIFIPPSQAALLAYQRYEERRNLVVEQTGSADTIDGDKQSKGHKGIVLEVDGPFHFESYLMVSANTLRSIHPVVSVNKCIVLYCIRKFY